MKVSAGDRALKVDALELLARINEGGREFTPEGESYRALEEFQSVVDELRRARPPRLFQHLRAELRRPYPVSGVGAESGPDSGRSLISTLLRKIEPIVQTSIQIRPGGA